jgi:dihydroorotase
MLGLETALAVVADVMVTSGAMTWADVARVMSQAPARIAGLDGADGHGGTLDVGQTAHLVLVDPAASWVVDRDASLSLSRNNPWHGRGFGAQVHSTYLRGVATVVDGALAPQG